MIKTVFINGVYDYLHYGHFQLIKHARSLGGFLMVAIDSDERVKEMKGVDRPFHTQEQRLENLTDIKGVGVVQVFNSDEELTEIIKKYAPDVMVIGSDWKGKKIIGSEYAKEVVYFKRIKEFSTTKILSNAKPK